MAAPESSTAGVPDPATIRALDESVRAATGHPALGDAVWRDVEHPGPDSAGFGAYEEGRLTAYVRVARSDTFAPQHWILGLVREPGCQPQPDALLDAAQRHIAVRGGGGEATIWIFDPADSDDEWLARRGYAAKTDLYQMRVPLPLAETAQFPDGMEVRAFEPGRDEDAWLTVNNAAFGNHPDQGGWVRSTLERRMAEPWFDPSLFVVAFDDRGLAGSNWLKVHEPDGRDPRIGEIFVIGVDPGHQGLGLGRALAVEGLAWVSARGITTGMLYVVASNAPALSLYRALGFTVHRTDRAYVSTIEAA